KNITTPPGQSERSIEPAPTEIPVENEQLSTDISSFPSFPSINEINFESIFSSLSQPKRSLSIDPQSHITATPVKKYKTSALRSTIPTKITSVMGKTITKKSTSKKAAAVGIPIATPGTKIPVSQELINNLERDFSAAQANIKCPNDICKKKGKIIIPDVANNPAFEPLTPIYKCTSCYKKYAHTRILDLITVAIQATKNNKIILGKEKMATPSSSGTPTGSLDSDQEINHVLRYPTNWFQHHNYALPVENSYRGKMENLTIHCLYLLPSNLTAIEALEIIQSIPLLTSSDNNHENTILCGDFNARHKELLGDQRTTPHGTAFANWIEKQGFTEPLANVTMPIESKMDLKSDHKPVCISFTMDRPPPSRENHSRQLWNLSKLYDDEYQQKYKNLFIEKIETVHDQIKSAINTNNIEPDINYIANQLTDCIHTSLDESVKWFWNEELETAFQDREQCYRRKVKATGIQQGVWNIKHKEASKKFDSLVQKRKRQAWNNFINKLSNDELSNTTATIKRIRQTRVVNPTFSDMAGPEVAANKMSQQLACTFSGNALPRVRANPPPPPIVPHPIDNHDNICSFTPELIQNAIQTVARKKAPGMDHLRAEILGLITEYLTNPLTNLFILCWKWSKTPDSWRLAQVVPIYKKGDANDPANYRPISLLSVLHKTLEICLQDELHSASPDIDEI
ncbi:hypothetical protein INT45_013726, partial [Circinella minor]